MKIGYARVSTDDQNPDLQLAALKQAGCKRTFIDKATGAHLKRPKLAKCLKALVEGDTLTVWKLDRLGRSLRDLIGLLDDLKARGVIFRSITEAIDTASPTGRAMWQMVGILAELERSLIQERTKAGRSAAVAHARKLIGQGEHHDTVAQLLNVSRRTLYRALQRYPSIVIENSRYLGNQSYYGRETNKD